jgi:hypothetical protein
MEEEEEGKRELIESLDGCAALGGLCFGKRKHFLHFKGHYMITSIPCLGLFFCNLFISVKRLISFASHLDKLV